MENKEMENKEMENKEMENKEMENKELRAAVSGFRDFENYRVSMRYFTSQVFQ